MKRLFTSAFALLCCLQIFAQSSNVILYTENGERFYAIFNGMRMNDVPVTNLKIEDLNQPNYGLKIIFENKDLGEMNKNIYLELGQEVVYSIKMSTKGQYKLAYKSAVPIAQAAPPAPEQQIVYWGAPSPQPVPAPQPAATTTVIEETVTTTTTTPDGENVSVNINANGLGINMNVNANGTSTSTNVSGSTTTTTTTTTIINEPAFVDETVVVEQAPPCPQLDYNAFESAKRSIKAKSFADSKMTLAKQITERNCLSADQIKDITTLFDFESDRLEYAKFGYNHCFDLNNYYKVNDAFEFESSIEELDEYISGQR